MNHTPAEIAAGKALHLDDQDIIPEDWDTVDAEDQAAWIKAAMAIVRAHNELADEWRLMTDAPCDEEIIVLTHDGDRRLAKVYDDMVEAVGDTQLRPLDYYRGWLPAPGRGA